MRLTYSPSATVDTELERLKTFVREHYPWHPVLGSVTHRLPTLAGTVTLRVANDKMEVVWYPNGSLGPTIITFEKAITSMLTITHIGKCYKVVAKPNEMLDVRELIPLDEEHHLHFVRVASDQIPDTLSRAVPLLVG